MSALVDTQIALWWQAEPRRLSRDARTTLELEFERGDLWVSRASLWEVAIKASTGKLRIDVSVFAAQVEEFGFRWLDIRNEHLLEVAAMPFEGHKDPFDRLLVAQARVEYMMLLTADGKLRRYGDLVHVV